jgi:prepilin-type N-terminal cleavage/methylation domain-containing protein
MISCRTMRGFTLIELLIVVAIIALLAAIAVPNFLEAQIRAKNARAESDMRTHAVALEAYCVDFNRYPMYGNHKDYVPASGRPQLFIPHRLTTPIAYASSLTPDVFGGHNPILPDPSTPATYYYIHDFEGMYLGRHFHGGHLAHHHHAIFGWDGVAQWSLWSWGPDLADDHGVILYDPSNGTISQGDFMRFGP